MVSFSVLIFWFLCFLSISLSHEVHLQPFQDQVEKLGLGNYTNVPAGLSGWVFCMTVLKDDLKDSTMPNILVIYVG